MVGVPYGSERIVGVSGSVAKLIENGMCILERFQRLVSRCCSVTRWFIC